MSACLLVAPESGRNAQRPRGAQSLREENTVESKGLKAACLAVGLASAWGAAAPAQADSITVTTTPTKSLTHVYFLYGSNSSGIGQDATLTSLPDITLPSDPCQTGCNISATPPSGGGNVFSVMGLYGPGVLTIGLTDLQAANVIATPTSFEAEFPGFSESTIATALANNDTATLRSFFLSGNVQQKAAISFQGSGELINFSNSTDGGPVSAMFTPVPEPSTLSLLAVGLVGAGATARRRIRSPVSRRAPS
jgi:hypothetical protein